MLIPVVVRDDADGFELVAGFHRVAAAKSLGVTDVPVVVRDVDTEDADRAVENITSCRHRHDVINADRVVMPMSVSTCPRFRCERGVAEPSDRGDPITLEREHHQPVRTGDRPLGVREVAAERGLTVGPRGDEPEG
jgi:hypothetical protein